MIIKSMFIIDEILGSYENAMYQKCSLNYSLSDTVEGSCSHVANIFYIGDKGKQLWQ